MSVERRKRLSKLVRVQNLMKDLHETKRAGHVVEAQRAQDEADALANYLQQPGSLSSLFSDLYHNRIAQAQQRRDSALEAAAAEAKLVTTADLRAERVAEKRREITRELEEKSASRERQELVERRAFEK